MPSPLRAAMRPDHASIESIARSMLTELLPCGGRWLVPGFLPPMSLFSNLFDLVKRELRALDQHNKELSARVHQLTQAEAERIRAAERAEEQWKREEARVQEEVDRRISTQGGGSFTDIRQQLGYKEHKKLELGSTYREAVAVTANLTWSTRGGEIPSVNFSGIAYGGGHSYSCKWWDKAGKKHEKTRGSLHTYRYKIQSYGWKVLLDKQERTNVQRRDGRTTVTETRFTSVGIQLAVDHRVPFT